MLRQQRPEFVLVRRARQALEEKAEVGVGLKAIGLGRLSDLCERILRRWENVLPRPATACS